MKHNMNLNNRPFKSIKEGTKTINIVLKTDVNGSLEDYRTKIK